jgi:colanic acid/amylovoran biosynthesis glycosyltransferase
MKKYEPVAFVRQIKSGIFPLEHFYCYQDVKGIKRFMSRVFNRVMERGYEYHIFKKNNILLLHSHFGDIGYGDLRVSKKLKVPHITTFYGCDLSYIERKGPIWIKRYSELFEKCDLFLVEGHHMKKCLVALGCPQEKITVQRLGIDLEKIPFIPRQIGADGKIKILASGTFTEKKGLPYALEAFAHVREKHKNLEFILIGGVPDEKVSEYTMVREEIFKVIEKYEIRDYVKLMGYLPYDEYVKVSQEAHIFISPSVHAKNGDTEGGAPVSIIEMSASGIPILSTFHCDIPEVVDDGQTGYLVPERDVEALVERLDYLITHPEQWHEMGIKGRQHIKENYNIIKQVEKLESIYADLIEKRS